MKTKTKTIIIFPYSGYKADEERELLFWDIVKCCNNSACDEKPIVILNVDTERSGNAAHFLKDERSTTNIEVHRVWSVDTCQMWLSGWGYVIDKRKYSRIVQLPGDIDSVANKKDFFNKLGGFIALGDPYDFIIGDFSSGETFNAKDLIDTYGTYPLLANWFPEITRKILQLPLKRPRSEFLNMRVDKLSLLLKGRKFAYEQTLNMLIHSCDSQKEDWIYNIRSFSLGDLMDDSSVRKYKECLDQIERMERMLKLLWRELHEPNTPTDSSYDTFLNYYNELDKRSTAIRDNSRIIIRNLLSI